jgi:DNA ligase-4
MKEATIANMYHDILGFKAMKSVSDDKMILNNWKNERRDDRDLGKTIETIISKRVSATDTTSTLKDINDLLDRLADSSNEEKIKLVERQIYNKFSAMQQKWIIRIILKDLKLGLTEKEVIGHLHPAAYHKFASCLNLKLLCELDITEEDGIEVGSCFMPMLAHGFSRAGVDQVDLVESGLAGHPFIMDVKLDGVRVLAHLGIISYNYI